MKIEKIILLNLIFAFCLLSTQAYSHAKAKQRNKCGSIYKKYLAKAVVNGPGSCKRIVDRQPNCEGAEAFSQIFHQVVAGNTTCDCQVASSGVAAAQARAKSYSYELSEWTYKSGCSGYRAGGAINSTGEVGGSPAGNVESNLSSSGLIFDYINNTVTLNGLNGYLENNTADFINEYSIFNVSIALLTFDADGNVTSTNSIFQTQAAFINGILTITGGSGGFQYSEFTNSGTAYGSRNTLTTSNKIIVLNTDITDSMDIEVTISGDVGNIKDGNPEESINTTTLNSALSNNYNTLTANILSHVSQTAVLEVRNMSGTILQSINNIALGIIK